MMVKNSLIDLLGEFGYKIIELEAEVAYDLGYAELKSASGIKIKIENSDSSFSDKSLYWKACLSFVYDRVEYETEKFYWVLGGMVDQKEFSRQEAATRNYYQGLIVAKVESGKLVFSGPKAHPLIIESDEDTGDIHPEIEELAEALIKYYGDWRNMLRKIDPNMVKLFSSSLQVAKEKYKDYLTYRNDDSTPPHFQISPIDIKVKTVQ